VTTETEIPSVGEVIDRMRAALAEMGYGDSVLEPDGSDDKDGWPMVMGSGSIPRAVWWTACFLVYPSMGCWACDEDYRTQQCETGHCQHPEGPAKPPRELLVRRA